MKKTSKKYLPLRNPSLLIHICLSFFLHIVSLSAAAGDTPAFYTPTEEIALYCGSPTNATQDRTWIADTNTTFFIFDSQTKINPSKNSKATQQPRSGNAPPYVYARISYSEFTYVFSLTPGQKFIRLYFYPTSYPNFDPSKAFFSVKANQFTLLRNFSALLHATYLQEDTISKEFCLNVYQNQKLSIIFTPSPGDHYAFINGIEIVSMPTNLYYTRDDDAGFKFIGQEGNLYQIRNNIALEMMHRINVGGNPVSPMADTGMYRRWTVDNNYLTDARGGAFPVNLTIHLSFTKIANYSAPIQVYQTAMSMGLNKTINENYYLTWQYPVDSGFTYFVRLHFCEFQIEVVNEGDRVFGIQIANQTAETNADVISWSGGNGVPVYKNYAVMIGSKGSEKKQNLSIALHPTPEWRTKYSDAILNGVEIFKLSNSGDLSAPNPDVEVPMIPPAVAEPTSKSENNRTTMFAIVGGVVSSFFALSVLGFLIFWRKKRDKDSGSFDGASRWKGFSYTTTKSSKTRNGSFLPSDLCRYFSLAEIKTATNNFDNVFIVGVGGFGNVYKGFIDGGATAVAIKRLNPESQQGALEFKTEIEMLSQLRHLHLVSLIGYCNDDREMILVYDYMAHGTLRDHLYKTENPPLPWNQRLQICIGAARGLHYLHTGAKHTIIHRDVKSTNILLDEKWVAKVSDFGLSKVGPTSMSKAHVSTVVKGSFGYLDPEYYRRQQLTEKSDVYSFGVVLFEVLCARPPINRTADKKQVSLAVWAQKCYLNEALDQIVDPFLKGKIALECLKKFGEVAIGCLHDEGIKRPSMNDVVWGLEFALQLQENAEQDIKFSFEINNDMEAPLNDDYSSMVDDSGDVFSSIGEHVLVSRSSMTTTSDEQSYDSKESSRLMSGAVFSEIKNPEGR